LSRSSPEMPNPSSSSDTLMKPRTLAASSMPSGAVISESVSALDFQIPAALAPNTTAKNRTAAAMPIQTGFRTLPPARNWSVSLTGQALMHSPHDRHSLVVTCSTDCTRISTGQARSHFRQLMHVSGFRTTRVTPRREMRPSSPPNGHRYRHQGRSTTSDAPTDSSRIAVPTGNSPRISSRPAVMWA